MKIRFYSVVVFFLSSLFVYSQEPFTFNYDGTAEIEYKVDKSSDELYKVTLDWVNKYYNSPEYVIIESIPDEMIKLDGSLYKVFYKDFQEFTYDINNKYESHYILTLKFYGNKYTISYVHEKFTLNGIENDLSLINIIDKPYYYRPEWKENYEYRVGRLLTSINHYIKENELLLK